MGEIAYTGSSLNRSQCLSQIQNFGILPEVVLCAGASIIVTKKKVPAPKCYQTSVHLPQTPKMYCGADIGDLTDVLQHINTSLPHSPLLAVGASMGRYT